MSKQCPNCGLFNEDRAATCDCGFDFGVPNTSSATSVKTEQPAPEDLIFVGLNGYALALHRDTGEIVWYNSQMKSGYVSLLLDGDRLVVSTNGYIYCLNPLNGEILWNNPLKGYGMEAPTHLISIRGQSSQTFIEQAAAAEAARPHAGS